ncbi:hypothetical protein [Alteromonas lipotrueae]|uniref:hypothetical protein n=1 Tax=Alteromonas lipotrueae TaxID=2803814 RepID=UPI001C444ECC|nr:hypothetical protein [Alteromonas lipotrueae]
MNWFLIIVSLCAGCLICKPLFVYLFKAVSGNAAELDKGFNSVYPSDSAYKKGPTLKGDEMRHEPESVVESAGMAMFVVLLLPLIPSTFLAIGIYFALTFLIGLF